MIRTIRRITPLLLPLSLSGCDSLNDGSPMYVLLLVFGAVSAALFFAALASRRALQEKAAELEKTHQDSKQFKAIFHSSPVPQALLMDGMFTDCNRAFETLLNRKREEIIDSPPWEFMPAQQPNGDYSMSDVLMRTAAAVHGKPQHYCRTYARLDGTMLNLDVQLTLLALTGHPVLLCAFRDVTEEQRSFTQTLDLSAVLRSALENAPLGILLAIGQRGEWRLAVSNREALRLLGLTANEAESIAFREKATSEPPRTFRLLTPEGAAIVPEKHPLQALMEQGSSLTEELMLLERGSEDYSLCLVSTTPVYGADGSVRGEMAVLQDVTEHRQSEQNLRRAKDMAERANTTKNEFLANMSHELRTPLNAVLGMLQLLKRDQTPEDRAEFVDIALRSGRSLLTILSDILDLVLIETGEFELKDEGVNVTDLVGTVIESFSLQAKDKNIDIDYVEDQGVPDWIVCDAGRLRQVLFNLIGNAVKFTNEGSVRIESALLPPKHGYPHSRLYFSVSDTGIGIPSEKIACIFDPFIQADGSMTREFGGAGLGLSIARRLVARLGGEISLESQEGAGTTFHFTLLVRQPLETQQASRAEEPVKAPLAVDLSSARVLLVEDDKDMQYLGCRFLKEYDISCEVAENGQQALDMLRMGAFNLVLMDIQMPVMDGIEATKRIRSGLEGIDPNIPIVAMTAHGMLGDKERFLEAGMTDYLSKPVDEVDLVEMLRRHVLSD